MRVQVSESSNSNSKAGGPVQVRCGTRQHSVMLCDRVQYSIFLMSFSLFDYLVGMYLPVCKCPFLYFPSPHLALRSLLPSLSLLALLLFPSPHLPSFCSSPLLFPSLTPCPLPFSCPCPLPSSYPFPLPFSCPIPSPFLLPAPSPFLLPDPLFL